MKMLWKNQTVEPYESFYRRTSERFFRGAYGGGISRTIKCDDDLTIIELVYEDDGQIQFPDSD